MSASAFADTLRQIEAVARTGRLDEAANMFATVDGATRNSPAFAALGGAIEFYRGQFSRALGYLQVAHQAYPDDLTIRANYAESLYRCDRGPDAAVLCGMAEARADKSLRLASLGGHLALERAAFGIAVEYYQHIVSVRPDDWSSWNNLGNALASLGEVAQAVSALERAAALAPNSPPIHVNLGNCLVQAGRLDEAETALRDAANRFTTDPTPLLSLFTLYRDMGREDDAYDAIRLAAARAPTQAPILSDFGQEAARRNEYAVAETSFEAALRLEPSLGPAYVGLASVYERVNRDDELEPLRQRGSDHGADAASIAFIDALIFKRANDFEAAFAALERAGDVVVPGRKWHLRGTILDRLNRKEEAFDAFVAMNAYWAEDPSLPLARAGDYRASVAHAAALVTPEWVEHWPEQTSSPATITPIFLVGFPRSGTTLLDTMLMADPCVAVLEEEPFIGEVEQLLGGIDALPTLTPEQVSAGRSAYFERVSTLVAIDPATTKLVDKHPMHLNKVPIIRRLFPDARFILSIRHPCDVVLSCFITNFRINNAMSNFLTLDDAARLYDQTFAYWERARALFNLDVKTVVYERLVEDAERELRPLFDQLGLVWPDDALDHRISAKDRGTVRTASYAQVTEPIYRRAAGRWHGYADQMTPVLPALEPWVKRFGYSLDDGRHADWGDDLWTARGAD